MRGADAVRREPGRRRGPGRLARVAATVAGVVGLDGLVSGCSVPLDGDEVAEAFAELPGVDGQRADCLRNKLGWTCSAVVWMDPASDPADVAAVVERARDLSGTTTLRLWLGEPDQRAPRPTTAGPPVTAIQVAGVSATVALHGDATRPETDLPLAGMLTWAATTPEVAGLAADAGVGARMVRVTVQEVDDDPAGSVFWSVTDEAVALAADLVVDERGQLVAADSRRVLTVPGRSALAGETELARTVEAAVPLGLVKVSPGYVGLGVTDPADLPEAVAVAEAHPSYSRIGLVQVADVAGVQAVTGTDPDQLARLAPLVAEAQELPGVESVRGTSAGLVLRGESAEAAAAALTQLTESQPGATDAVRVELSWPGAEVHLAPGDRTMVPTAVAISSDPAVRSLNVRPGSGTGAEARAGEVRVSGPDHVATTTAVARAVAAERPGVPLRVSIGVDVPGTIASVRFELSADPGPEISVEGTEDRGLRRELAAAWRAGWEA